MNIIRKIAKRLIRLRYYLDFIGRRASDESKSSKAYISIKKINPNRRLFHVCAYLGECGYACYVNLSLSQFISMDTYGLKAIERENVFPSHKIASTECDLVVTDTDAHAGDRRQLILDYSIFDDDIDYSNSMFFPMHFHPDFMSAAVETSVLIQARDKQKRKIGILFAGNCDRESYDREETRKRFNIHTRWDIFSHLSENFPRSDIHVPDSYMQFNQARQSGQLADKLVLIDINVFKIPQADWFDILTDTLFFIHLPGYIQPWCHNQIESMASGSIPITEFPHLYHPELVHMDNAIIYREKDELVDILQRIVRGKIDKNEMIRLRENVLSYYSANFSFAAFNRGLSDFLASEERGERLYICAGLFDSVPSRT